jgi:hypothetical protein
VKIAGMRVYLPGCFALEAATAMRFFPLMVVFSFVSCTQLPPPVARPRESSPEVSITRSGERLPVIKPALDTRLVMEEAGGGVSRMVLEGADARRLHRLLGIAAEETEGGLVKRGRDIRCFVMKSRSYCEWRWAAPFGNLEELQPLSRVVAAPPEGRQTAWETPYIGVASPEWGRRARIKIALGFAERIFDALSGARAMILPPGGGYEEGARRMGEQVNCLRTRRVGQETFVHGCFFHLNLSNGAVDKTEPDQQD